MSTRFTPWAIIRRRPRPFSVWLAIGWLGALTLCTVFADLLPGLPDPTEQVGPLGAPPEWSVSGLLGTDTIGRSNLSRIIYGARISLVLAVFASAIALLVGVTIGLIGGYYRGVAEGLANFAATALASVPPLLLLLALVAAIGASLFGITVALGLVMTTTYIRVTMGAVIGNANREYVLAAKSLGAGDLTIMIREILPNLIGVLGAMIPITMSVVVVAEGSLSFLGYGIPAPTPSWGGMIASGADVIRKMPIVIAAPIVTLFLTVYSFNTLGRHLGASTDSRETQL